MKTVNRNDAVDIGPVRLSAEFAVAWILLYSLTTFLVLLAVCRVAIEVLWNGVL